MDNHLQKLKRTLRLGLQIQGFIFSLMLPKFLDDILQCLDVIDKTYTEIKLVSTCIFFL